MKLRNVIAAVAFALTCAPALADPATVTFSVIAGAWTDPAPPPSGVPNSGIVITNAPSPGTSQIRWGDPYSPPGLQSGYDFTPAGGGTVAFNFNVPGSSAPGLLGVFNHLNFPIFDPQYLQSVTLNVSAHIILTDASGNHDLGVLNFVFDFTHDETPNGGIPGGPFSGTCPYGPANGTGINSAGCADRVTVTSNAASQVFNIDGVLYTLDILGFSQDGGTTISNQFLTVENQNNVAGLYAIVRAVENQIPEPGTLALVGLALLAVGFMRRKSIS